MKNTNNDQCHKKITIPPSKSFLNVIKSSIKETLFYDDPFGRPFKGKSTLNKIILTLKYFIPILEWGSGYNFSSFKSDFISGITIASLAIPQGISYASLANIPPIIGLYSSFVPPLVYAVFGSSKDLAVGPLAITSILIAHLLGEEVDYNENPQLYVQLVITSTFFAGVFQASLGFLRLGLIVDLLSHAAIVGFMSGAASIVCLQQLKGILGLKKFTHKTDIVNVMESVFTQTHNWKWQTGVIGCVYIFLLIVARFIGKRKPSYFWFNALAPLTAVITGTLLVYLIHGDKHGISVIGTLKKGLNPPSLSEVTTTFRSGHLILAIKSGVMIGIIGLAEGVAVGRSFAILKNYQIDGNKEMVAFGIMNIVGSLTSCYITAGPFSRSAVNYNAGCKTAVSNIVMAIGVMLTLLFLTPLFYYTPNVVLSAIILSAMIFLIKYKAAIHLFKVDRIDFFVAISAYIGVIFGSVEIGLMVAVSVSFLRLLLSLSRPRIFTLGKLPGSTTYRSTDQYPEASRSPGVLVLHVDGHVYFTNANYLRERIMRWIYEEEDNLKEVGETSLQYVILDISSVGSIDTSGITMLEEVNRSIERKGLKLALANPRSEVIKKLEKAKFIETIGQEWLFLTVEEAVDSCKLKHETSNKSNAEVTESNEPDESV